MRCAILPVYCKGTKRQASVTKAWLEHLGTALELYYDRQSGGQAGLICSAFDWTEIPLTTQQWLAAGAFAGRQTYQALALEGVLTTSNFDHFVVLIDDQLSHLGVTPKEAPETSLIAAREVTATIVAHELGHRFGAGHTYLASSSGPIEYGGPYSVMGGEGGKHDFIDETLVLTDEGADSRNARNGPGMCFANLTQTGWANPDQHAFHLKPYSDGSISQVIELIALDGAPPPHQPIPIACIIELDDWYVLEYRSATTGYDAGVPNSVAPSCGNLVLYQSPAVSPLTPLQIAEFAVQPGNILSFNDPSASQLAQKAGGTVGVLIQVTILSVDPGGRKISLRVEHQEGKPPQYQRTDDIFDYLLWNRELISQDALGAGRLISELAEIHHLSRLQKISGPRDSAALRQVLATRIRTVQELTRSLEL